MTKIIRITILASITAGSLSLMALQCMEKADSSEKEMTALMAALSVTHCQRVNGFCSDIDTGCGITAIHVGWCGWGCPDKDGVPDTGMCCIPINSCADVGGVCRLKTEDCPDGTGGTVFMDCPQGADGQCCIPFK